MSEKHDRAANREQDRLLGIHCKDCHHTPQIDRFSFDWYVWCEKCEHTTRAAIPSFAMQKWIEKYGDM